MQSCFYDARNFLIIHFAPFFQSDTHQSLLAALQGANCSAFRQKNLSSNPPCRYENVLLDLFSNIVECVHHTGGNPMAAEVFMSGPQQWTEQVTNMAFTGACHKKKNSLGLNCCNLHDVRIAGD